MRCRAAVLLVALASTSATACGGGADAPAEFTVEHAWARPTPTGAENGVVYLTVVADVDDAITAVHVPADIAGSATLHTTVGESGSSDGHHGGGADEMMSMQPIESVELVAGEPFEFSPGGNHIMLEELPEPLELGQRFTIELDLGSGRSSSVDVVVADNRPTD